MSKIIHFSLLLIAVTLVMSYASSSAWAGADGYNPALAYEGKYKKDVVYYKNPKNPNWYQGLNGEYPQNVLCRDALKHFSIEGMWMGHFNNDGSCGPTAEPTQFAVGNRLNYDDSLKTRSTK
jgi:hypothetical protein